VADHAHRIAYIRRTYDSALAYHADQVIQNLIQGLDLIRTALQENLASARDNARVELLAKNAEIGVVLSEKVERWEIAEIDAARRLFGELVQSGSFMGDSG
jgi:hypothetical protein